MTQREETCNFAHPGTFGHECGKPAVWTAKKDSKLTTTGIYHVRRCPECQSIKGGENAGLTAWERFDPVRHANTFIR